MDEGLQRAIQGFSIQFLPLAVAIIFHEFSHGWAALKFGDPTARDAGRLTLNPLPHVDWIGTVVFPAISLLLGTGILFGWAKPVPIRPELFKKFRPGLFWVAAAGPGMNFILAVVSAFIFCAFLKFVPHDFYLFEPLTEMAKFSIVVNFALGVFNLLPLPPLDGSKLVQAFLSTKNIIKFEQLSQFSFFILIVLIFSGALSYLMVPVHMASSVALYVAAKTLGLDLSYFQP